MVLDKQERMKKEETKWPQRDTKSLRNDANCWSFCVFGSM